MFQEDSCYVKKHRPMSVEAGPVRHFRKIDRLRIHIGNDYAPCVYIHSRAHLITVIYTFYKKFT